MKKDVLSNETHTFGVGYLFNETVTVNPMQLKEEPMEAVDRVKGRAGFFFLLLFFLMVPSIALGTTFDVNKYWSNIPPGIDPTDTSDSSMCWAATASNVLAYTGWGIDNPGTTYFEQYEIYHEFLSHFPNAPGTGINAYQSYFQWHPVIGASPVIVQLYPEPDNPNLFLQQAQNLLSQDYGLYLSLQIGHAVTLWSFGTTGTGFNYITVTDSDDYYSGTRTYEIIPITEGLWSGYWAIHNYRPNDRVTFEYAIMRRIDALAPLSISAGDDFVPFGFNVVESPKWTRVNLPIFAPELQNPFEVKVFRYSVPGDLDEPDGPYLTPEPPLIAYLFPCLIGWCFWKRFRNPSA